MEILLQIPSLTKEQEIKIAIAATKRTLEKLDNGEVGLLRILKEEINKEIIENLPFSCIDEENTVKGAYHGR